MPDMRLLIADDHELIRRGLRQLLLTQTGWQVVAEASSGTEAVQKALRSEPDVAVLDCYMPGLNGLEAAAQILKHRAATKIILLTAEDSEELQREARSHKIADFLLKTSADRTLVSAIASAMPPQTKRRTRPLLAGDPTLIAALTGREEQVLRMLANGASSREIAVHFGISVRTVESHRSNLNVKCGFSSLADLVRFAILYKDLDAR